MDVEVKKNEDRNLTCPKAVNLNWGYTIELPGDLSNRLMSDASSC